MRLLDADLDDRGIVPLRPLGGRSDTDEHSKQGKDETHRNHSRESWLLHGRSSPEMMSDSNDIDTDTYPDSLGSSDSHRSRGRPEPRRMGLVDSLSPKLTGVRG